jgi:acetoin utilization deacetylase AcuC-like enzyme
VHHGNGTQGMFYEDPAVMFVSSHQFPFYPGTGAASDIGRGEGLGKTVNLPLEAGAGDADNDLV